MRAQSATEYTLLLLGAITVSLVVVGGILSSINLLRVISDTVRAFTVNTGVSLNGID